MGESLMMPRRVREEGPLGCKSLSGGGNIDCPPEEAPAKYVPAAAVIRMVQALFGITGHKGCVGGYLSQG